ncbi:MAG TPA: hypothetical protein PKZ12_08735 [Smithellaceae bacterium]|nr:hypothetical protein [Smithellaceae bacterium]
MNYTYVFIHGLESTSQGTKGQYFRRHFPAMIIEYYTGDFNARMTKLNAILSGKNNLILIGSSYGGLMASVFAAKNENLLVKMILLAPALLLPEFFPYQHTVINIPVVIYHGTHDTLVDPLIVRQIAEKIYPALEYHKVDDDHPLTATFPLLDWIKILQIG